MNRKFELKQEIIRTIKWSGALAVPAVIVFVLLLSLLGGIEGGGKLLFLIGLAPMITLDPITRGHDGPLIWVICAVAEFTYFSVLVLLCRYLRFVFRK